MKNENFDLEQFCFLMDSKTAIQKAIHKELIKLRKRKNLDGSLFKYQTFLWNMSHKIDEI